MTNDLDQSPLARFGQGSYERLLRPNDAAFLEALTGPPAAEADAPAGEVGQGVCCACGELTVGRCGVCRQPLHVACRCSACANKQHETALQSRRPRRLSGVFNTDFWFAPAIVLAGALLLAAAMLVIILLFNGGKR